MQAMPSMPPMQTEAPARPAQSEHAAGSRDKGNAGFKTHLDAATGKQKSTGKSEQEQTKTADKTDTAAEHHTAVENRKNNSKQQAKKTEKNTTATSDSTDSNQVLQQPTQPLSTDATADQQAVNLSRILDALTGQGNAAQVATDAEIARNADGLAKIDNGLQSVQTEDSKLAAMLDGLRQQKTAPNAQSASEAGSAAGAGEEITIEHWSARFSIRQSSSDMLHPVQASTDGLLSQQKTGTENGQQSVVAYTYSLEANEETIGGYTPAGSRSQVETGGQRQDINGSYIHANLPNNTTKAEQMEGNGQQAGNNGQNKNNMPQQPEHLRSGDPATATTDGPLVFTLGQANGTTTISGHQAGGTATSQQPASALPIPEHQVMDQVIDRFTMNRQLESGAITLKLHPQELGELRMEIKVEQDNIKAHITTHNPQVQDILDRHMPKLREALEQQGMNLEQMKVTVADGNSANAQLFQDNHGQHQLNQSSRPIRLQQAVFSLSDEEREGYPLAEEDKSLSIMA